MRIAQPQLMINRDQKKDLFVLSFFCLKIALLAIFVSFEVSGLYAQNKDKPVLLSETVEGEISRRQTQIIEAEKLMADGDAFAEGGNFKDAISKFIQAYNEINPSPLSEDARNLAKQKFINAAILRSKQLIDEAEFVSAEELLDQVLQPGIDPKNNVALTLKQR